MHLQFIRKQIVFAHFVCSQQAVSCPPSLFLFLTPFPFCSSPSPLPLKQAVCPFAKARRRSCCRNVRNVVPSMKISLWQAEQMLPLSLQPVAVQHVAQHCLCVVQHVVGMLLLNLFAGKTDFGSFALFMLFLQLPKACLTHA